MTSSDDHQAKQNPSDFSIDHILNKAGTSRTPSPPKSPFSWLQCTRYCPPKIPRAQRREGPQRRQLGRHPRIPFTSHQLAVLEEKFQQSPYLSSEEVIVLSSRLQLADVRVKIWFQNRRARERREKALRPEAEAPSERVKLEDAPSPTELYNFLPAEAILPGAFGFLSSLPCQGVVGLRQPSPTSER